MSVAKSFLSVAVLAVTSVAHAGVLDLGAAASYNLLSFGDFVASGSDVEGAVAVAGNVQASSYSINASNRAANGHALVVGGNLNYGNGSISHGDAYVGGSRSTYSLGFSGAWQSGISPLSFSDQLSYLSNVSLSLSGLASTGTTATQWGGLYFTGGGSGVEVFNASGSDLASVNWASLSNIAAGSTIILNVSGSSAGLSGGTPNVFANYNVLYNFYEATSLSFNNVGVYGSILAPLASVTGGGGQINGNVIVADWNSNIQVNANRYFVATDIPGFTLAVPEPRQYMMLLAGFALVVAMATLRRRQPARVTAA